MSDPETRVRAVRWVDDPWSALTTGEADAWRAGWEAARERAVLICIDQAVRPADDLLMIGRAKGAAACADAVAAMEPPA
jgi:hypothetical protein